MATLKTGTARPIRRKKKKAAKVVKSVSFNPTSALDRDLLEFANTYGNFSGLVKNLLFSFKEHQRADIPTREENKVAEMPATQEPPTEKIPETKPLGGTPDNEIEASGIPFS